MALSGELTVDYTEMGIGVKQDMESAKRWYMRAAGPSSHFPSTLRIDIFSPTA